MTLESILLEFEKKCAELENKNIVPVWRHIPGPVKNPAIKKASAAWPVIKDGNYMPYLKKNQDNWFYGECTFPASLNNITLADAKALLYIQGWVPFTLWIDGKELFNETHAWFATGPIADPFPLSIEPGRTYHLVIKVRPTEIPADFKPVNIEIKISERLFLAIELGAAVMQLRMARYLATAAVDKKLLADGVAMLDREAFAAEEWGDLIASIACMEARLSPLSKRAKALTVHCIGHSHIDMDWLWTWDDTVHCIRRDAKAALDIMRDHGEAAITISQIPFYEVIKKRDPQLFKDIKKRIREGRWENAAGTWVEGDLAMAHGEAVARQMQYAVDWTQEHLGNRATVLWEPDTFGHPGNMPQLAKLGGFSGYYHHRCNPGYEQFWPLRTWQGIDGSPITAVSTNEYNNFLTPLALCKNLTKGMALNQNHIPHVWGVGDHGGALSRLQLELLERYRHKPLVPTILFGTMENLLATVRKSGLKLPISYGETGNRFEGCFTTHASIKRYNRMCEEQMLTAETLCALADTNKSKALKELWTPALFNQFHDILDGAAVHDSYINAHVRAKKTIKHALALIDGALKTLVTTTASSHSLTIVNSLGTAYTGPVEFESVAMENSVLIDSSRQSVDCQRSGKKWIFIAHNIKPFSSAQFTIVPLKEPSTITIPEVNSIEINSACFFRIETKFATIIISKESGAITGFYDKTLKQEYVAYGLPRDKTYVPAARSELALNVFQLIEESPVGMSAWLINSIRKEESLLCGAAVKLIENGPVFARIEVTHKIRSSTIKEQIVVYHHLNRIDFKVNVDWQEIGSKTAGTPLLKLSFGSNVTPTHAVTSGPFCIARQPVNGMEYPTQQFVDVCDKAHGFTIVNDCKYGYDALGGRVRISLVRNPYSPDPIPDQGRHEMSFSFIPHGPKTTPADVWRQGMQFNRMPLVRSGKSVSTDPFISINQSGSVVCTALRFAEHSNAMVLRFFEVNGKKGAVELACKKKISRATVVNFLEEPQSDIIHQSNRKLRFSMKPYEVKSILIE